MLYLFFEGKNTQIKWQQIVDYCPPRISLSETISPSHKCLDYVRSQLPFDISFQKTEEGKQAQDYITFLWAWELSLPAFPWPEDGLILGQAKLPIPDKYLCKLAPQRKPQICGFDPQQEPSLLPNINQRLFQYFLRATQTLIYHTDNRYLSGPQDMMAATIHFGKKRGFIDIYPLFSYNQQSAGQLYTLISFFHETEHFFPHSRHIPCNKEQPDSDNLSCDAAPFTGPFGANMVLAELFRQLLKFEESQRSHFIPRRSHWTYEEDFDPDGRCKNNLCAVAILRNYCKAFTATMPRKDLPFDFSEMCPPYNRSVNFYTRAIQFLNEHSDLFSSE